MKPIRILLAMLFLVLALTISYVGPAGVRASEAGMAAVSKSTHAMPVNILAQRLDVTAQAGKTRIHIQPPYAPAPGEQWEQVAPYLWHYYKQHDSTAYTEKWYVMGREGLQWELDNLIGPKIKNLEAKLALDSANKEYQGELKFYQTRYQRIAADMDKVGSYYSDPNATMYTSDRFDVCNYASTSTNIGSQISASGQACSSGSSPSTSAEYSIWRNYQNERNSTSGTTWSSIGVTRAKIPGIGCSADAWSSAYWGPFWWDRQDSDNHSSDSDCI